MTMTKASLGEARELYEARQVDGPADAWRVSVMRMADAARFVERLLPEKCPCFCHAISYIVSPEMLRHSVPTCDDQCSGQLWDEGLVEAVAKALSAMDDLAISTRRAPGTEECARAVLSALAQEVGR